MCAKKAFILFTSITILFTSGSILFAKDYISPNYILSGARVVIAGGKTSSASYSLNDVIVGSLFGNRAASLNYSLDASSAYNRRIPPNTPTLNPITSPVNTPTQSLSGRKDPLTSIYINGYEKVPLNTETNWNCSVTLVEGSNFFLLTARNIFGLESDAVPINITLDTIPPSIVITSPKVSQIVYLDKINVEGTIDGISFIEEKNLGLGLNALVIDGSDQAGNTSSKNIEIYRAQEPLPLP